MTGIPYNYGKYIDDTVKLRDQGHVDAGKQVQSPASAGSRGLNKTVQFTKDPTQMKMGESITMEDMKSLISRIDGLNVPTNEAPENTDIDIRQLLLDISAIKNRISELAMDDGTKTSALTALGQVEDDIAQEIKGQFPEGESPYTTDKAGAGFVMANKDKIIQQLYAGGVQSVLDPKDAVKAISDLIPDVTEKEIIDIIKKDNAFAGETAVQEDTKDDIMQWAKKYSQYKNLEDNNLIEALYEFAFDLGITQFIFEVGELQAAERKLGKKQEDWEDKEINAAMEMSSISNGLLDDLHKILPGNADLEQKLDSIRDMLEKAGLKEDKCLRRQDLKW